MAETRFPKLAERVLVGSRWGAMGGEFFQLLGRVGDVMGISVLGLTSFRSEADDGLFAGFLADGGEFGFELIAV